METKLIDTHTHTHRGTDKRSDVIGSYPQKQEGLERPDLNL